MSKPEVTICISSIRPQNWKIFWDSLEGAKTNHEIIFVGPNPPTFDLPSHVRYIETKVKITQCWQIAANESQADTLTFSTDDMRYSPHALDSLYEAHAKSDDKRIMMSAAYVANGQNFAQYQHYFFNGQASPQTPFGWLLDKDVFCQVGGIESRFVGVQWDVDLALRVIEYGGHTEILPGVVVEEFESLQTKPSACDRFWNYDRPLLDTFWANGPNISTKRMRPIQPFICENILTYSYGTEEQRYREAYPDRKDLP